MKVITIAQTGVWQKIIQDDMSKNFILQFTADCDIASNGTPATDEIVELDKGVSLYFSFAEENRTQEIWVRGNIGSKINIITDAKHIDDTSVSAVTTPLPSNITQVGGVVVPVKGTTPIVPMGLYDANGDQIVSFGGASLTGNYFSPLHFTATYLSASTLTLTAFPTELVDGTQISGLASLKVDNTGSLYINGNSGISFGFVASTGVLTIYQNGSPLSVFTATDVVYRVVLNITGVGDDITTNTQVVTQANPSNTQYLTPIPLQEITSLAAGTAYYPDATGRPIQGMKDYSFQYDISGGVTLTFEMTNETIATPVKRYPCTQAGTISAGPRVGQPAPSSLVDEAGQIDFDETNAYKIRAKIVTTDATNAINLYVIAKGF